jgi:hypothetical protein
LPWLQLEVSEWKLRLGSNLHRIHFKHTGSKWIVMTCLVLLAEVASCSEFSNPVEVNKVMIPGSQSTGSFHLLIG